jgi:hypothetical protein
VEAAIFSDIKDAILVSTSICTLLISYTTIKKWKVEYKGKAYFDAAIKFKKTTYNLKYNFNSLRVGVKKPDEMHPDFDSRCEQKWEHEVYVIKNRYNAFKSALGAFYDIEPEMEAFFGKSAKEACDSINAIIGKYRDGVNEYLQLIDIEDKSDRFACVRRLVYNSGEDDQLEKEIADAVKRVDCLVERYTHFDVR